MYVETIYGANKKHSQHPRLQWFIRQGKKQKSNFFLSTRNYGALRAPPLLAPAPRGHCRFHVYNGPCAKKKIGLGRPLKALRPLEGPWEARHRQGPPVINAVVKRNCLSQKKFRPWPAFDGLEAAGGFWGGRTPSGTIRD